ncbi:MAG: NADH-quinone oxidoreductase subunit C [Candidatus Micrarchaeota archaeon]
MRKPITLEGIGQIRKKFENELRYARVIAITCMPKKDVFELYYHFGVLDVVETLAISVAKKGAIRTRGSDAHQNNSSDCARVQTISDVFPSSAVFEQEISEMFGVMFDGNKNSGKPLFLSEESEKFPMRGSDGK